MRELIEAALDAAESRGATYADVRVVDGAGEALSVRGPTVESLDRFESVGIGVRVLARGAWGYACTSVPAADEATRAALLAVDVAEASSERSGDPITLVPEPGHEATWSTPDEKDPLEVDLATKLGD